MKAMMQLLFLLLIAVMGCQCKTTSAKCRRSDAEFNNCVKNQMNSKQQFVKKGLPRLKIAPLDPLYVPKIRLRQGTGPVSLDLTSTDQIFRGIINYRITSAKMDLKNYQMDFAAELPWFHISAKSKMEGRILAFPINGEGDSWSNYTMLSGTAVLKGHPVEKDGKEFFSVDTLKYDMTIKSAVVQMSGLFNGNEELATAMNKLMSDNWEIIFEELKPVINKTVEEIMKDIATKLLNHYSLDELFPK